MERRKSASCAVALCKLDPNSDSRRMLAFAGLDSTAAGVREQIMGWTPVPQMEPPRKIGRGFASG